MRDLERRVERLEAERGADKEATLEEAILWSYRDKPFDPETQRQYDEFCQRLERSRLGRFLKEAGSGRPPEPESAVASTQTSATANTASAEPAAEPAPAATAFAAAPSPEDAAIAFLKTKLGDGKPHPVVQVHNDADAAGIDPDALNRARNMLPIETRSGPGRPSTWSMAMDEAPAPPDAARNRLPIEDASPRPTIGSGRASVPEMDVSARIQAQQNWLASEAFVVRNDIGVPATNTGTGKRT